MLVVLAVLLPCLFACGAGKTPDTLPAVVVALTASSAEPAPQLNGQVLEVLQARADAARDKRAAIVQIVVAGQDKPGLVDLTPMRGAKVERIPSRRSEAINASMTTLSTAVGSSRAGTSGLDLLSLLDRARRVDSEGELIAVSSGLQTAPALDLRVLGWRFNPDQVAADLARRHELPDLRGRKVTFVGLGLAAGKQPGLSIAAQAKITQLWLAVCRRAGAATCTALPAGASLVRPSATRPVPVIRVETPATCSAPIPLPAAALFARDSFVLGNRADRALAPLARQLQNCPAGSVADITGHAADVIPGRVDGVALSLARAQAVRDRLLTLGLPASVVGAVTGVGDRRPVASNWAHGRFVEKLAARNRRVEVSFRPIPTNERSGL